MNSKNNIFKKQQRWQPLLNSRLSRISVAVIFLILMTGFTAFAALPIGNCDYLMIGPSCFQSSCYGLLKPEVHPGLQYRVPVC